MAAGGSATSNPSHQTAPKILLAKPPVLVSRPGGHGGGAAAGGGDEDSAAAGRSRLPSIGSLNLLTDSWDFNTDRFLPFLTDNTDFTVVGVIGPTGAGKSTIMNEIYGFDAISPDNGGGESGMLPPFAIQSEETKATAKHCTLGIEPRISSERIILLDTQPVFSPSVLAEMIRPDGSSTISVLNGVSLLADLAHELMSIQLGVFLASVCHIILVVSEGSHDLSVWRLMSTVDLLKHDIPDPSSVSLSHPQGGGNMAFERDNKDKTPLQVRREYMATPVFVLTKLRAQDIAPQSMGQLKKAVGQYFRGASLKCGNASSEASDPRDGDCKDCASAPEVFIVPSKDRDDSAKPCYESHMSALWKLRNQVLSMNGSSFARTVSEREWLKNSAKVWEMIKNSPIIADYCRTLQSSGMFRR